MSKVKKILRMCEEVINGTKVRDLKNCYDIEFECCDCPFSRFNNKNITYYILIISHKFSDTHIFFLCNL